MFARLYRLISDQASEGREKRLAGGVSEKENGNTDTERGLDDLIMPELEELIFTAVAIAILKMFSRLLCFQQVKAIKIFSKKLYASKIKKKRSSGDEKQRLQLQKCPGFQVFILEQSSDMR